MASHDDLARALEEKTRRLAAERLELAEAVEREIAELRQECERRVAAERERVRRLEAELAELRRSKTLVLSAPVRRVYYALRRRR